MTLCSPSSATFRTSPRCSHVHCLYEVATQPSTTNSHTLNFSPPRHHTMSTTTVTSTQLQETLSDYTIHLTGAPSPPPSSRTTNPPNWPASHRRVPNYQALDTGRDPNERPNGSNAGERAFLRIMFGGLWVNAVSEDKPC